MLNETWTCLVLLDRSPLLQANHRVQDCQPASPLGIKTDAMILAKKTHASPLPQHSLSGDYVDACVFSPQGGLMAQASPILPNLDSDTNRWVMFSVFRACVVDMTGLSKTHRHSEVRWPPRRIELWIVDELGVLGRGG
jgi:hypothetical protein